jgi:hypothetical protein
MAFKRKKELAPSVSLADLANRVRGLILDSQIQHAHELSEILGCAVLSDEVQEREEEESDKRIAKISYLVPLLFAQVHLLAEGAIEYQKENVPEEIEGIPEEIWRESRKMMEQVSLSALMGSVSQLVDMGLLEIPRKYK